MRKVIRVIILIAVMCFPLHSQAQTSAQKHLEDVNKNGDRIGVRCYQYYGYSDAAQACCADRCEQKYKEGTPDEAQCEFEARLTLLKIRTGQ